MNTLQVTWFCLIGLLIAVYAILDGFDLGVGFWYLFTKKDSEKHKLLSSILPYWDGNEVWLLAGGGAVFAAFPHVYATVFSGFYLPMMLVLLGLIFRAVAIEFRSHSDHWQRLWDAGFAFGSILPALLLGVAAGNILRGLPLDAGKNFTGSFFTLLNPYSLLVGVTGLAMFATHGALFAAVKTSGETAACSARRAQRSWVVYLVLYLACVALTVVTQPQLLTNYSTVPVLWALPAVGLLAILAVGHWNRKGAFVKAFVASGAAILAISAANAAAIFPKMVPSLGDPALSLTIANSSSSPLTLKTMLVLALIGVPLVLVYTVWVHLTFGGKTGDEVSY